MTRTHTRRSGFRLALPLALTLAFAVPRIATAEPTRDPASAQLLFEQGRAALAKDEVDRACELLAESLRLDPAVGTFFNLAACEERQGRVASAWLHLREGIGLLPPGDARTRPAEARAVALERRVPQLAVRLADGAPEGTRVHRDGVDLGAVSLGLPLPVNPGDHTIVATAKGHAPGKITVTLHEAERRSVVIAIGRVSPDDSGPSTPGAFHPVSADPGAPPRADVRHAGIGPSTAAPTGSSIRTLGFITGGVGLAALGVGVVAGLITSDGASDVRSHCDRGTGLCDQAGLDALDKTRTWGAVSTVGILAGCAFVVTGVILLVASKVNGSPSRGRASLVNGALPF